MFVSTSLIAGAALGLLMSAWPASEAGAKGPGRTYCFLKTCHRVKSLAETQALVGKDMTLVASFYDSCARDRYNPCGLTSSGERFRPEAADNAASPLFPDGTILLVWSPINRQAVVVRINNAGPYWGNRTLDLSRAAARKLALGGVGKVKVRVLKAPSKGEATYRRNRSYEQVPGPIGTYASLEAADTALASLAVTGVAGSAALKFAEASAARPLTPAAGLAAALKAEQDMHAQASGRLPEDDTRRVVTAKAIEWPVVYNTPKPVKAKPAADGAVTAALQPKPAKSQRAKIVAQPAPVERIAAKVQKRSIVMADAKPVARPKGKADIANLDGGSRARRELAALVKAEAARPTVAEKIIAKVASKSAAKQVSGAAKHSKILKTGAKDWSKPSVAKAPVHHEIVAGYTTFAEKHYFTKPSAAVAKPKAIKAPAAKLAAKANVQPAPQAATAPLKSVKVAGKKVLPDKPRKAAALHKPGALQTSDLGDLWTIVPPRVQLNGPARKLPAGLIDGLVPVKQDGIRARPSALV